MIVLKMTMMAGRTFEQKAELIRRLSEAAANHLNKPLSDVRFVLYEVPHTNWGIGGRTVTEIRGLK